MAISPYQRLTSALPPTVIFHGTVDRVIPERGVTEFVEKARALGSTHVIYRRYPDRGHEFYYGAGSRQDYKDTLRQVSLFLKSLHWL